MFLDERVRAELASGTRFGDVRLLPVTDSTNRVVRDLAAAGAPEGVVVAADEQTAGRGRLGRRWDAPAGTALLVSVLLRPAGLPPARRHLLTAAAGLAARDACREVAGVRPDLKWPNDLLVGDRKLAGILAEGIGEAVVVGMGLNVHAAPPGAACLAEVAGRRVARAALLVAWLRRLDALLGDWAAVAAAYRAACTTVGRPVRVEQAGGSLTGRAVGLDADGRLLVAPDGGGPPVTVAAGDVTHLRHRGASGARGPR